MGTSYAKEPYYHGMYPTPAMPSTTLPNFTYYGKPPSQEEEDKDENVIEEDAEEEPMHKTIDWDEEPMRKMIKKMDKFVYHVYDANSMQLRNVYRYLNRSQIKLFSLIAKGVLRNKFNLHNNEYNLFGFLRDQLRLLANNDVPKDEKCELLQKNKILIPLLIEKAFDKISFGEG